MVQTNQISLYKKINMNLIDKSGLRVLNPEFSYNASGEKTKILVGDSFEGILTVNEFDSMWSPIEHDLEVNQTFLIEKPSELYGEQGVTMIGNKIGLAVHIHSKSSSFQKTIDFGTIPYTDNLVSIEFNHRFPPSSLRGNIKLDFYAYLKESNTSYNTHASRVGMILSQGDIDNWMIVTDGDGSVFPMSEFEDKNGPLWRLDKNWVEANLDTFDSSNVNLSLNIAHPLFEQAKAGKLQISRAYMGNILIQAMTMIIQQVIIVEKNTLTDEQEVLPDSILAAVSYWVSSFDIDTSSLFSIANTMHDYWDRKMIDGGKKND